MQSVYSATPADWATGHLLGESYSSAEKQAVFSTAPADWTTTVKESRHYYISILINHHQNFKNDETKCC